MKSEEESFGEVKVLNNEVESSENEDQVSNLNNGKRSKKKTLKTIWNYMFGIFIAMVGGIYLGLSSYSIKEAWNYCVIFLGEALICLLLTFVGKTYSFRKTVSSFILYFVIAGVVSPVASWFGQQIS